MVRPTECWGLSPGAPPPGSRRGVGLDETLAEERDGDVVLVDEDGPVVCPRGVERLHLHLRLGISASDTFPSPLEKDHLICRPSKSKFFQPEVEFCGHVQSERVSMSSPGKLLPLQKWSNPKLLRLCAGF